MAKRATILIAALILGAVAMAACGDDNGGSATGEQAGTGPAGAQGESPQSETDENEGDGGEAGEAAPVETSELSKAAFVKKASAACTRARGDVVNEASAYLENQVSQGVPRPVAMAKTGRVVMAPKIEAQIATIRKLGAPAGDEEEIEAILTTEEEEVAALKSLEEAKAAFRLIALFEDSTEMFRDYGLGACSNGP